MLKDELGYFIAHQDELVRQYQGKTLVIKDQQVVGAYESALAAYCDAQTKYAPGSFMIQPCVAGPDAYTVTIASQEYFRI